MAIPKLLNSVIDYRLLNFKHFFSIFKRRKLVFKNLFLFLKPAILQHIPLKHQQFKWFYSIQCFYLKPLKIQYSVNL